MNDRSDAIVVHLEPTTDAARKLVAEPRSDGNYTLVEKEWTGDRWRPTGTQDLDHIAVSTPGDRLVPGAATSE